MRSFLCALSWVGFILLPGLFLSTHKFMRTLSENGIFNLHCMQVLITPSITFYSVSVVGLNLDFVALNVLGNSVYGLFNIGIYWIPSVQVHLFLVVAFVNHQLNMCSFFVVAIF